MGDNTEKQRGSEAVKKRRLRVTIFLVVLFLLLFVILVFLFRGCMDQLVGVGTPGGENDTVSLIVATDTTDTAVKETPVSDDSVVISTLVKDTPDTGAEQSVPAVVDTMVTERVVLSVIDSSSAADTVVQSDLVTEPAAVVDTVVRQEDRCVADTTELWVYPSPSGGLHYGSASITFTPNRVATIQYRTNRDTAWRQYDGTPVTLSTTTTLYYDAIDSCGMIMERRSEYYEIEKKAASSQCDSSMVLVSLGSMNFCIDKYEWPNRRGERPASFVSYYEAGDSCFSVGKRLCTAEEWSIACSGPYSWKYPYGKRYERYGCTTHDSAVTPSGKKPECRSFYGAFDMSGNLLEWTATRSMENKAFYYVLGGFWESGPKSGCFSKRYSYYPQNQHNPVGFRCCSDVSESSGAPRKKDR